jgi:DNA-binding transcriptional LysR family regulator
MSPELRHLRYFVAVAEERSYTRAAARLNCVQQAVSAAVRQLEDELGVQLLIRTTRKVELTPAGQAMLAHGRDALDAAERTWRAAQRAGNAPQELSLAYDRTVGHGFIGDLHEAAARAMSDVRLSWRPRYNAELLPELLSGRFDAGVANLPDAVAGLDYETIAESKLRVILGARHRLARRPELALSDLAGETILVLPRDVAARYHDRFVEILRAAGLESQIQVTPDPEGGVTQELYVRGEAIGIAPAAVATEYATRCFGRIASVPLEETTPRVAVAVVRRRATSNPLVDQFIAVCRELAAMRPGVAITFA